MTEAVQSQGANLVSDLIASSVTEVQRDIFISHTLTQKQRFRDKEKQEKKQRRLILLLNLSTVQTAADVITWTKDDRLLNNNKAPERRGGETSCFLSRSL